MNEEDELTINEDGTISVDLDISKDDLLELCMEAHKRNLTLNELVNELLLAALEEDSASNSTTDEITSAS